MNQARRIVKAVHVPLHLMKPVRPKEIVMCLCAKCLGYDIQPKKEESDNKKDLPLPVLNVRH